ncbi:hypothetical protein FM120_08580 [Sphingobacterium faecium PCAi_F2.5]|nr:hypothetical protein FM120_08580 [Sphingobacterium faecium PCAi_F2.5]
MKPEKGLRKETGERLGKGLGKEIEERLGKEIMLVVNPNSKSSNFYML